MLKLIFEIRRPYIRKIWLKVLSLDTLDVKDDGFVSVTLGCEILYMMDLCVDAPLKWKMIYDGFVPRYISWMKNMLNGGFLPRWPLIVKYDIESILF
jgi:hypothetical protein